jgi:TusE/DsrC/DsvC family sulfur relay protein
MKDKTKIADDFAEVIKYMDDSVDTDIDSQQHTMREREIKEWDKEQARKLAAEDGIELTDEHFKVIKLLQDYYLENGPVESGRELGQMLDYEFTDQGGRKYLRVLFPDGPVNQGMRLAGLPVPPYSEDDGFGTTR